MTSRAEYRLLLRQDNADIRLSKFGHEAGLISDKVYEKVCRKEDETRSEIERVSHVFVGENPHTNDFLSAFHSVPVTSGIGLSDLIKRPELSYDITAPLDPDRPYLSSSVREQVNIQIKYSGYIDRQEKQVSHFKKLEDKLIPDSIDYDKVPSLRIEARQKLKEARPVSIGQASRILGVSPSDISVLMIYIESGKYLG